MIDQNLIPIVAFIGLLIAALLLSEYVRWRRRKHRPVRLEPEYVWLAVIGPSNAESTEDTYRGAYLLLMAEIRMELMMAELFHERGLGLEIVARPRVVERTTYSTEAFRPYLKQIRSLEDFGRYAPYRADRMMKLSVHPDDTNEAVRVLVDAGLTVERPPGIHFWH